MADAAVNKLVCRQNRTFYKQFTWTIGGVAVDLSLATAVMQVRFAFGHPAVLAELSTANGLIVLNRTAGWVELTMPPTGSNSTALKAQDYVYDIKLVFPDGTWLDWMGGTFTVEPTVTA